MVKFYSDRVTQAVTFAYLIYCKAVIRRQHVENIIDVITEIWTLSPEIKRLVDHSLVDHCLIDCINYILECNLNSLFVLLLLIRRVICQCLSVIFTRTGNSFEVKIEADSSEVTDYVQDDKPRTIYWHRKKFASSQKYE